MSENTLDLASFTSKIFQAQKLSLALTSELQCEKIYISMCTNDNSDSLYPHLFFIFILHRFQSIIMVPILNLSRWEDVQALHLIWENMVDLRIV